MIGILLLALLPLEAAGQGAVDGIVSDASTGAPLEFVNVGILGSSAGTVTDARGHYQLVVNSLRSTDSVTLRFSFTGYEAVERRVATRGQKRLDVQLKASATQLKAVEIKDEKARESSFTRIDAERLGETVGPTGGVEALLKTLPDVGSNNELSSQYSVRGGSFDENLVYINGVEVFRPMLIRSGQQEGMSIINPDLVDHILFSPGGFDASYGDKLSSVLDITYLRPQEFKGTASVSLLGGSASLQGRAGERLSYAAGLRYHSNRYVLGSLDTKGSYTTDYIDFQALAGYKVNEKLDLGMLAVVTSNVYGLVPESRTTTFGSALAGRLQELSIYFDGQEQDRYRTLLGAVSADWHPNDDWRLSSHLSLQHINERECYDVQSQYWLYELTTGQAPGDTMNRLDRGVGTFLEHARNRLITDIATFDLRANRYAVLGGWNFGLTLQTEHIDDQLREWRWVDSAGYALPATFFPFGDTNSPQAPILQQFASARNSLQTLRGTAFVQREVNLTTRRGAEFKILAGLRAQVYQLASPRDDIQVFVSPRISVSYRPVSRHDLLFRLAAGGYGQPPLYREYRRDDGSLNTQVRPQQSWQATATADWRFLWWNKPFFLTADLYCKYLTHIVPYTLDNLRLRYRPDLDAVGYAAGLSLRLNGELVPGLESWASLSLMQTRENISGDTLGWIARPTDQRLSFKLFFQDNVPDMPWWRMSLTLVYATGLPTVNPFTGRTDERLRLPSYYRIDWGNTVRLSQFDALKNKKIFRLVDDIQVGLEVFNLLNIRNVVSYLWLNDIEGIPWRVPNYLTARQLNLKLTVLF